MSMLNRRDLLTKVTMSAGGVLLSPIMSSIFAQVKARASGTNKQPLRFVFLVKSNGLWAENIQPKEMENRLPFKVAYDKDGRLLNGNHGNARKDMTPKADLKLADDFQLCDVMKSLTPFRHRISILQGINSGFPVYHKGHYQGLGAFAAKRRDSSEVGGQTIDSLLAQSHAGPLPHVCLGHDPKAASGVSYITLSADGPDKPLPFYTKPKRAYKELFGVVGQGEAKGEYETQSDILDFFAEDAKRLRKEVAGPERQQLDRYLNAFESVRASRKKIEAMSEQLRKYAPKPPTDIKPDATTIIGEENFNIAIAALASGLTNVVTISYDTLSNSSYPAFGTGGLHASVGHGQGGKVLQKRQRICQFHFEQMAKLAKALESIPEGDGTMLDNTVMIYTSNNGETHHSSGVNWPIVMLGNLGGRLQSQRYFAPGNDPKDKDGKEYVRLGDVWATLLAAAGQSYKEFGRPRNGVAHKPIESLQQ